MDSFFSFLKPGRGSEQQLPTFPAHSPNKLLREGAQCGRHLQPISSQSQPGLCLGLDRDWAPSWAAWQQMPPEIQGTSTSRIHWMMKFFQVKVKTKSLSRVRLFATPWTVAHQAPPSMGFSRQEYWSGLPFPSPGDLPDPGIKPRSPTLQADALTSEPPGKPTFCNKKGLLLLEKASQIYRSNNTFLCKFHIKTR